MDPDPLALVGTTIADKYRVESVVGEGGYRSFPYMVSRYVTAPREQWGRSPPLSALPDRSS
jgi:hypothetical protein